MKILDCTIRDGGYYTNWDFDQSLITDYCKSMEQFPIEYIEVGYRSIALEGYLGKYFYCPIYVLKELKSLMPSKKLVIILNEKDIRPEHLDELLIPIKPYVTLIRMAVDPSNFKRAIKLAKAIKKLGFEIAFNVMYMSNWKKDSSFLELLEGLDDILDYFYMVDSFGGILPNEVKEIVQLVKSKTRVSLGFHGHDNLSMGLINTITAFEEGCDIVDATISGMGRGAGNLKTELLLTYLESKNKITFSYNVLGSLVTQFENLNKNYGWGTSLPYMFSGAHSLPQKEVMEWVGMNRYSLSSILNALNNKKQKIQDNEKLPVLMKENRYKKAIIIGGGDSARLHKKAVIKYLENENDDICLIHAGTRNAVEYESVESKQYYGLVGFESKKLFKKIGDLSKVTQTCVFPPFPRKMGTTIPESIRDVSRELDVISFTKLDSESPMALAIQIALDLGAKNIYFVGFDGYDLSLNQNQFIMAKENQFIIDSILKQEDVSIKFLTPTKYNNVTTSSIYSLL